MISPDDMVNDYIDKKEHWRGELMFLRSILKKSGMEETIKWGAPTYTKDGKNIVGISAFKQYVGLWFFNGSFLKDEHQQLVNAQEGKTKALRQWRFKGIEELMEKKDWIASYIQEAIDNHDAGLALKPTKAKKKPLVIPELLQDVLDENEVLAQQFESLNLTRKREYAGYIHEAKREGTKMKRLEKIIPLIQAGLGLYDKYKA